MSDVKTIWDFLLSEIGNPYGVAGLMGNLFAESGLSPINLQNTYEKKLGMSDQTYTNAVDSGMYKNFVHDSAGYGLAQWTYHSRKQDLFDYTREKRVSIGNLNAQLEFLIKELSTKYEGVMNALKSAGSVQEASDIVLTQYERPANQNAAVKATRAAYGQKYFKQYVKEKKENEGGNSIMGKTISTGFISDTINGIRVDSSLPCNPGNYNAYSSRLEEFIVMHYTGNSKDTAKANANYFRGAGRNASAHFFVDDVSIFQSVKLHDRAWHCGAKSYRHASCRNANSIGIEMCCTAGNYKISEKTKENAAHLCAHLCRLLGISAAQVDTYVVRHYDVTGKNCPAQMAGGNNTEWKTFKEAVKAILSGKGNNSTAEDNKTPGNGNQDAQGDIQAGSVVTIKNGAVYGGLSGTRGKAVPSSQCGSKKHTVSKIAVHNGVKEALLKEIVSWVAVSSLTTGSGAQTKKEVNVGSTVTIKNGAVYGGLSGTRGKAVPSSQCGSKKHTVSKIAVHNGVKEALLKEIVSWVAVSSLTAV